MSDIINLMYNSNEKVKSPTETTELEECLCKKISDLLPGDNYKLLTDLMIEQYECYTSKIKEAYEEGFKDCANVVNQINNL